MSRDSGIMIIEPPLADCRGQRTLRLPERFSSRRGWLLAGVDAGIVLLMTLLSLGPTLNAIAGAIIAAACIIGTGWWGGLFTRSYAVYPHDEAYFACASAVFAAIPLAIVLCGVGEFPLLNVGIAILLSALGISVVHVRAHLERRAAAPFMPVLESVTPSGATAKETGSYKIAKRSFDIAIATVAALLLVPAMIVIAFTILLESGHPILFRQERIGKDGVEFTMFKFRTMIKGAGGLWAQPGDSRVTRLGSILRRLSLDEFPQLFNVLRGEMSIVGPRPEMVEFDQRFSRVVKNYTQRHIVTPGITGWAQLYFSRYHTPDDATDLLGYDLFYVENGSIMLDCAMILKTMCEVFFHRAV